MTLQEFITESIKSIINSVIEVKNFANEHGAIINPVRNFEEENVIWRRDGRDGKRSVTKIDFDIAVIVSKEENKKADGSINIQVLKVGGNASKLDANQTTSRLSFSIDVALPEVE